MTKQFYIGIDNGVSGGISVLGKDRKVWECKKIPIIKKLYFTKVKKYFNHIDFKILVEMFLCAFARREH